MEEMDYNLLSLVCVIERGRGGLGRDHLQQESGPSAGGRCGQELLARVIEQARAKGLTSDEHFTVDGTLLEAWAGAKSFQPKDQKPDALCEKNPSGV